MTTPADKDRIETLKRRMSPALAALINARAAAGQLPAPIRDGMTASALNLLATDRAPLESTMPAAALEAIVQRFGRPPLLIRNDAIVMEPLPDFVAAAPDIDIRIKRVEPWVKSVGRVEFLNADSAWGGTGWIIEEKGPARIVATNRHVARTFARRLADGSGAFMRAASGVRYGANIDFAEEVDSSLDDIGRTVRVAAITYLADDMAADIALLRIDPRAGFALPSAMQLADAPARVRDLVALIGYPAQDDRNDAADQARYFRDLYEVKRFAPGFVMQALSGETTLSHDCTSLGGNSGSPLISLDDGKVVGLHFAGRYGKENSAVGVETLKALLAGTQTSVAVPAVSAAEGAADGHHAASHFAGRAGFSPAFLDGTRVPTPWPGLPAALAAGLAKPSDAPAEPNELRYTNFGVKYSAAVGLPLITAVNIDGAKTVRIKRGRDKWFSDGRIPKNIQNNAANFADAEIDRGHMVRREDPNWGPAAQTANDDTFHYVNAAPQHSRLNQGKTLWQGLENHILDSARTAGFRACVFTGPILGPDDPEIDAAQVPLEYWKLVATLDADRKALRATAYLLSQGQLIRDIIERRSRTEAMEGIVLGEYRTFQISIADLAAQTGYDFSAYRAADPLARLGPTGAATESAETDAPIFVPIGSFDDLIL